jgi:enoyl-CoA hydratase
VPLIDGGTQRLPRVVGLGRTLDITRTGRTGGDEEVLAIGLVTELVEPGRPFERAQELAEALAAFPSSHARRQRLRQPHQTTQPSS